MKADIKFETEEETGTETKTYIETEIIHKQKRKKGTGR